MENSKKKVVGISVLVAVAMLVGIGGLFLTKPKDDKTVSTSPSSGSVFILDDRSVDKNEAVQVVENPLADRNVYFAGYLDATLTKESTVALENLPENEDFFLKYTITNNDTNEVVFETNLIAAGQCIVWNPGETLDEGTYELQFLASPYYQEVDGSFVPLTAGSNTVTYTITK